MMDYFDASGAPVNGAATTDAAATTNGTAQPGANGGEDLGMDEISVSVDGLLPHLIVHAYRWTVSEVFVAWGQVGCRGTRWWQCRWTVRLELG